MQERLTGLWQRVGLKINREIKISDLLTLITVIISAITIYSTLSNDSYLRTKEQANAVRNAAASALTKLERWQALQMSFFDDLQPVFITTSRLLPESPTESEINDARDSLWSAIEGERSTVNAKIIAAEIESAYIDAFAYFPELADTLNELDNVEESNFSNFIEEAQSDVRSFVNFDRPYTPAMLGNLLRNSAATYETDIRTKSDTIIQPIRQLLLKELTLSDQEVIRSTSREQATPEVSTDTHATGANTDIALTATPS